MRLRAVIFDFDGLILDTETPDVLSWQEIFRGYGAEYPEWYWQFVLGRGVEQVTQMPPDLLRAAGVEFEEAEVVQRRNRLKEQMLDELDTLPGVRERISEANSMGIPLAIASSSPHSWVDSFLKKLGLFDAFDHVVCADDVARAKPFPDLYILGCELLGQTPSDVIAFEDSPNGIAAARAAGVHVIAVPNPISRHFDLSEADEVVNSLQDVSLAQLSAR